MKSFNFLTPARIRMVSLGLILAAVVALLLWISPVIYGQADPAQAAPAFLWLVVFGVLLLVLNFVETRRQAMLRQVWVSSTALYNGSSTTNYSDVCDLIEKLVVSYVNADERTEPPQAPACNDFLLSVDTMTFEYDRNSGLIQEKNSAGLGLNPLRPPKVLSEGSDVSVVHWTGVVRMVQEHEGKHLWPFATVDELETILVKVLENEDSQGARSELA